MAKGCIKGRSASLSFREMHFTPLTPHLLGWLLPKGKGGSAVGVLEKELLGSVGHDVNLCSSWGNQYGVTQKCKKSTSMT